jgi:hypothetical protein
MLYPSTYHRPDVSHVRPILGTLTPDPLPESGFDKADYPVAWDARSGRL